MPALPTTNLTLQLDASEINDVWKTYVSGGPNTGVPADGDTIEAWEDYTGASKIGKKNGTIALPTIKITTPLMYRQCLNFDAGGGTPQSMVHTNNTGTNQALSTVITNSAYTLLIAYYALSSGAYHNYQASCIFGDSGGYFGLYHGDDAGTHKVSAYNYDGSQDWISQASPLNASHVARVRHTGGTLYISVDGSAETSVASGNTSVMTGNVYIGRGQNGSFNGRIGEIAVYNVNLTGSDLTDATTYFTDKWLTPPATNARAFATLIQ